MSKICIGIVFFECEKKTIQLYKQIEQYLEKYGLSAFFDLPYSEPFFEYYIEKDPFTFSISDSKKFDNCDMFLLPDNSFFNGKKNQIPFNERMIILEDLLKEFLNITHKIELFIGDSGTLLCEFEKYCINMCDFSYVVNQINSINPIDLHIVIQREKTD